MKSLIVILTGLVCCWWFTDVRSESGFFNLFLPLCGVFFFIALLFWLVFALAAHRSGSGSSPNALDMLHDHDNSGGDGGGE